MDLKRVREAVKASTDVIMTTLAGRAPREVNGHPTYICPFCNNGTGSSGDGLAYDVKRPGYHLKCFACGFYGDVIELYQKAAGKDHVQAVRELAALAGITGDLDNLPAARIQAPEPRAPAEPAKVIDHAPAVLKAYAHLHGPEGRPCQAWLAGRGISEATAKHFCLGYNPGEPWSSEKGNWGQWLVIPKDNGPHDRLPFAARRLSVPADEKAPGDMKKWLHYGSKTLFNGSALSLPACCVTEGEIDAMSIYEATGGRVQAVALGNADDHNLLWRKLVYMRDQGQALPAIIICLDRDENTGKKEGTGAGEKGTSKLAEELTKLDVSYIIAGPELYMGEKDVNKALLKDRKRFAEELEELYYTACEISGRSYHG